MEDTTVYDKIIDKGIRYGFVPYDTPILASYKSDINKYELGKGWLTESRTVLVIGETEKSYITKLSPSEHGEWKDERILYKYILPLGFHKSRLINWEETQLSLF